MTHQRPLELILARNLLSALSTPAFLVDEGGVLVFYNEAAGALLGKRYEELGTVGPEEWGSIFGPFDDEGEPLPYDELPLVIAVRNGHPAHADFEIRSTDGARHTVEVSAFPILTAHGSQGAIAVFWPSRLARTGPALMQVKLWGTRGSIPSPGPETIRYGGNTSCVGVTLSDGSLLALDAGTGIRSLGLALGDEPTRLHILLTHLHLDHIQGLVFFAPAFRPQTEIVIWGPASPEASLRDRIARYISAPLSPVEVRELPCDVSFRHCPEAEWEIGPARIRSASVDPPRPDPRLPDRRRRQLARLHPRPRARPRRRPRRARRGLDLRLRAGPRRLAADPRRPVLRRRVPRAPRLGPLGPLPRARLRQPHRRRSARVLFHHDPMHSDERLDRLGEEAPRALGGDRRARGRDRARRSRAPSTSCRPARPQDRGAPPEQTPPSVRLRARWPSPDRSTRRPSGRRWSADALEVARARPTPARSAAAAAAPLHRPPGRRRRAARRARLLATRSLAAALLHDVVEDSEIEVEDIREPASASRSPSWSRCSPTTNRSSPTRRASASTASGSRRPAATRWRSTRPTS